MELQAKKAERYRTIKQELREKELAWANGHGTIENGVLTVTTTGTLSGCGQSFAATYNFNGRK